MIEIIPILIYLLPPKKFTHGYHALLTNNKYTFGINFQLIAGCRESDVRIRTALGDCLGELGAIDPGR